jgi:hypothetical protein
MELKIDSVIPAPEPTERKLSHRMRFAVAPDREGRHPPFLVLVEDWFAPPAGFPTHPHRGVRNSDVRARGRSSPQGSHRCVRNHSCWWSTVYDRGSGRLP